MAIGKGIRIAVTKVTFEKYFMEIEYAIYKPETRPVEGSKEVEVVNRILNEATMKVFYSNNKLAGKEVNRLHKLSAEILNGVLNIDNTDLNPAGTTEEEVEVEREQ